MIKYIARDVGDSNIFHGYRKKMVQNTNDFETVAHDAEMLDICKVFSLLVESQLSEKRISCNAAGDCRQKLY